MRDPAKEVPSDTEMQEAGVELGWLQPGDPVPPRMRARLARVVQEAWRQGAAQKTHEVNASAFCAPVLAIMTELTAGESGLSESAAARIVAATAPSIWRDINKTPTARGAAHS